MTLPLVPLRPKRKKNKKVGKTKKIVHSSSSFVIVQNDLSMAIMNDHIIRTQLAYIDEEPTDPENLEYSTPYLPPPQPQPQPQPIENLDTIVTLESIRIKKPRHQFNVLWTNDNDLKTKTVS